MKQRTIEKKRAIAGWVFIAPWLCGIVLFFIQPLISLVRYSVTDFQFMQEQGSMFAPLEGGWWENYRTAFQGDALFPQKFTATLLDMLYRVPVILIFSLFVAIVLNQKFKGRGFMRLIFFLPVLVLMALWISWGKAGRLARTGELFFLLLAAAAAAVVGLALFQVKGENLLPLWTEPAAQTLYAALPVSGVLGYGLYAAFLYTPEEGGREGGRWVRWCAGGCLALCGTQLVILGVFGPALTAELESPFFQMAKSVGVEGAFQRVESLVAAVWSFSDLILLAGLLQGMKRIVGVLLPKASPHAAAVMLLASAGVVGLAAFPNSAIPEALGRGAVLWGNLLLALALPLLAVVVKWFRH